MGARGCVAGGRLAVRFELNFRRLTLECEFAGAPGEGGRVRLVLVRRDAGTEVQWGTERWAWTGLLTKGRKGMVLLAVVGVSWGRRPPVCFHWLCSARVCLRCRCLRKPLAIFFMASVRCCWSLFQREGIVGCLRFRWVGFFPPVEVEGLGGLEGTVSQSGGRGEAVSVWVIGSWWGAGPWLRAVV